MLQHLIKKARFVIAKIFYFTVGVKVNGNQINNLWVNGNARVVDECPKSGEVKTEKQDLRFSNFSDKKIGKFRRSTSGTTGSKAEIVLDSSDLSRMLSVRDYCYMHYGVRVGYREARIWGQHHQNFKSRVLNFLLNRKYFCPLEQKSKVVIDDFINWDPDYIYGYSSLVLCLSEIFSKTDVRPQNLELIVCTAEMITETQKNYISDIFGVPVVEEYGSTEFDVIAFECRNRHRHLVNPWIELSEVNGNILFTDTARTLQPISNYDLGDAIRVSNINCRLLGSSLVVDKIFGRSIDMLAHSHDGISFHSVEFAYAIDNFQYINGCIFDFKVVQEKVNEFEVFINKASSFEEKDLKLFIEDSVNSKVCTSINVNVVLDESFLKDNVKRSYFVQRISM